MHDGRSGERSWLRVRTYQSHACISWGRFCSSKSFVLLYDVTAIACTTALPDPPGVIPTAYVGM
jgi:hypothetical protein